MLGGFEAGMLKGQKESERLQIQNDVFFAVGFPASWLPSFPAENNVQFCNTGT